VWLAWEMKIEIMPLEDVESRGTLFPSRRRRKGGGANFIPVNVEPWLKVIVQDSLPFHPANRSQIAFE